MLQSYYIYYYFMLITTKQKTFCVHNALFEFD